MSNKVCCNVCGGAGTVIDMEDEYSHQYELSICEKCNGTGQMDEKYLNYNHEDMELSAKARRMIMRDITS